MNTLTILIQVLRRRIFGSRFPGAEKREGLMRDMFCVSFQMFLELLSPNYSLSLIHSNSHVLPLGSATMNIAFCSRSLKNDF